MCESGAVVIPRRSESHGRCCAVNPLFGPVCARSSVPALLAAGRPESAPFAKLRRRAWVAGPSGAHPAGPPVPAPQTTGATCPRSLPEAPTRKRSADWFVPLPRATQCGCAQPMTEASMALATNHSGLIGSRRQVGSRGRHAAYPSVLEFSYNIKDFLDDALDTPGAVQQDRKSHV